jgi:hypothetical protein
MSRDPSRVEDADLHEAMLMGIRSATIADETLGIAIGDQGRL